MSKTQPVEKPTTPNIAGSFGFSFAKVNAFKADPKGSSTTRSNTPKTPKTPLNQPFQMNLEQIGSSDGSATPKSSWESGESSTLFTPRARSIGSLMNFGDDKAFKKPLAREHQDPLSQSVSQSSMSTTETASPNPLFAKPLFAKRDGSPPRDVQPKKQRQEESFYAKPEYRKSESISSAGSTSSRMSMGIEIQSVIERWEQKYDQDKEKLKDVSTSMTRKNRELMEMNKRFETASSVVVESLIKHKQALKLSELKFQ
jgi:hypothetical protein